MTKQFKSIDTRDQEKIIDLNIKRLQKGKKHYRKKRGVKVNSFSLQGINPELLGIYESEQLLIKS